MQAPPTYYSQPGVNMQPYRLPLSGSAPNMPLSGSLPKVPLSASVPKLPLSTSVPGVLHPHTPRMTSALVQAPMDTQKPGPDSAVAESVAPDSVASRIQHLMAAMGKHGDGHHITVRDILKHIDAVKAYVPQLLLDFPKIDQDGSGKITAEQLESYLSPESRRDLGREELQEIWEQLKTGRTEEVPGDQINLQDMARHRSFLERRLPELVERFHEVDTDKSCSIERSEFDAFFGNGEAWLEAKLMNIIGLEELKEQIRTFYWATRLDRMRRRAGSFVNNDEAHVLMFKGNPGVGKTTIARLITGLLYKISVIPTENFVEVQRDELVGDHIGATERATEEAISKAKGGVLFVDEAYRLNVDVFGVEAINCLMKAMTVKGNVIILAGYPKQMDEFVSVNPGIKRRVTYEFTFPDYTPDDMAKIFEHQVKRRGFEISPQATTERIADAISRHTTASQRMMLNGGVGEHTCRHAIFSLNRKQIGVVRRALEVSEQDPVPSVVLEMEDIEFGCLHVPDTSNLGSATLPPAWETGKGHTNGIKRGHSGLHLA